MKMGFKKVILFSFLFLVSLVVSVPITIAVSSTFLPKAQDFYQKNCAGWENPPNPNGTLCFLIDKTKELSADISNLSSRQDQSEQKINNLENFDLIQKRVLDVQARRGSFWSTLDTSPSVKTPDEVKVNCPVNCVLWVNYDVDTRNTVGGFQHLYHIYIDDIDQAVFNQATMTTANAAVPLAVNGVFPVSAGSHTVSVYVRTYGGNLEQHESHLQVMAIEE